MISYTTDMAKIDWNQAATVIELEPLGKKRRDPEQLRKAFESSQVVLFVFDSQKLVGMARALCDGQYQAAVYDLVLLPEYQQKGIGRQMMRWLREMIPVENIILFAAPGREGFYSKCGFKKMRTAMAVLHDGISDPETGYLE